MKYINKTSLVATIEELIQTKFIEQPIQFHCNLCFQTGNDYPRKWFIGNIGMEEIIICEGCLDNIYEKMEKVK